LDLLGVDQKTLWPRTHLISFSKSAALLIDAEMPAHVADYKMSLVCTWLGSAKECAKPRKGIIKHKQHQIEQAQ
jgi:hypothetical protein